MSMFSIAASKAAPADGRLERIEVDHEQIDRGDAVRHRLLVLGSPRTLAGRRGCAAAASSPGRP